MLVAATVAQRVVFSSGSQIPSSVSVGGVGDVDGDGRPDFILGKPLVSRVASQAGSATVYSGATGMPILTILGTNPYGRLGTSVAIGPDLNGDGHCDPVVGAPGPSFSPGHVRIHSGVTAALLADLSDGTDEFGRVAFAVVPDQWMPMCVL